MLFDYDLLYKKPDKVADEQWEAAKGQAKELTPDKGKVWTLKLSKQGKEAYNGLGHTGDSNSPLTDKQKLDFLITTTRDQKREALSKDRRAAAQKKYQPLLDANAAKSRRKLLTEQELLQKLAEEDKEYSLTGKYKPEEIATSKRRIQMKHINSIYSKQIEALEAQRMKLAEELDDLRSKGIINNAKRAQFEELGKQIETLNGKMYNGSGMDPDTLTGLLDQRAMLQKEYDELNKKDPYNKRLIAITNELGKINKQLEKSNLDHWLAAREKEFEEHNAAIDKEWEDIENKINAESEVKDGDIELEHAVAKETGGYYQQVQEEGETARTRAQKRIIEKFQEAADKKDTRTMRKILEQHPDIAQKVGYDPVAQRKFNRLKNSEEKVGEFAEREKAVYGTEFSDDMKKLATKVLAKNPGMTEKQALEAVRNQMLGAKTPTGETFVSPKDKQAARKFTAKQAERNAALQAEAAKHKKQFDYMADRISNAVTAGNLTPQQGQLLLDRAKKQYETSMSTLAVKNGGGGKQQFTPQPPTVRQKSVDGIVGNMLAVRDAELLNDYNKLDKADQAVIYIQNGGNFKQLPAAHRNALIDKYGYNDVTQSSHFYDKDGDGNISDEEAKAANLRVRTTFDKDGNPTRNFYAQTIDFDNLDSGGVKSFFTRGDEQLDKLRRFTRLAPKQEELFNKQYLSEEERNQKQRLLEQKEQQEKYKVYEDSAESALKKAQSLYNQDYHVKYGKNEIRQIADAILQAEKRGEKLSPRDIEKLAKSIVTKNNEIFKYGKAIDGINQDVYHRLSESNGAKFINQSDDVKRAIALRYAQMMPKLNEAFEVAKTDKKKGAELLRKLEKEWHRKSESAEEGGDSRGIFFPFYGDLLKLEMDIAQKDLEDMDKANRAETNDKGEFIRDEHGNIKGGKIGRAWNDFIEFYKNGGKLDDFSKRFGGTLATYATTDGDIAYSPVSSDLEAIKGREDEFANYLQHIRPELEKYTKLMEALKRHGRKFNEFEHEKSF